jgi:restriction system protein
MIFATVVLGALGFGAMLLRKKKAPSQPVPVRPASARPVAPAPAASATTASSVEATPAPSPAPGEAATTELQAMRWEQFELLVGEIFRRHGYVVELSSALGADGTVDLMLRRDGECIPVQCKHWKTARVGAPEMREFYGTMTDTAAPRGIFVTMGTFTREAREFAEGKAIELLDGSALHERIAAIRRPEENIFDITSWIGDFTASARIYDPECPICRGAMVIRHNRSNGAAFWGCATYPRCAGKRDPRVDLMAAAA